MCFVIDEVFHSATVELFPYSVRSSRRVAPVKCPADAGLHNVMHHRGDTQFSG